MNNETAALIRDFKHEMNRLYGTRLNRVVLFGSRARDDFRPDSDVDLMVVLNEEPVIRPQEIRRIAPIQSALSLRYGLTLSVLPVGWNRYNTSQVPVYQAARQEGIAL